MVKALACELIVSKFELQLCYYVHFLTNTFREKYVPPYHPSYGLNSTTTVSFRKMDLALNNPRRLCHKTTKHAYTHTHTHREGCPRGVMVKVKNCRIVVSEFVLQSHYYVHFWANTLGKGMNLLILPTMG